MSSVMEGALKTKTKRFKVKHPKRKIFRYIMVTQMLKGGMGGVLKYIYSPKLTIIVSLENPVRGN